VPSLGKKKLLIVGFLFFSLVDSSPQGRHLSQSNSPAISLIIAITGCPVLGK